MIKVQFRLPKQLAIACSGGVDSMAIVDFLRRKHDVKLIHVNHNEGNSDKAEQIVTDYAKKHGLKCEVHKVETDKPSEMSWEEFWRTERYKVFIKEPLHVVTGHHLDDCVETWIWSSLNGIGKIIPYANRNVIRPFRLTKKEDFINWASKFDVPFIEDDSNQDMSFTRNIIRHQLMPVALKVNPGLHKVILKKIINN